MKPKRAGVDLGQRSSARIRALAGLLLCLVFAATERLESLRQSG